MNITKEEVKKIMATEGEVRGVVFKTDGEYFLRKEGKNGLDKLEEELKRIGCPIEYEKIKTFDFYPIGMRIISLLAIKEVFGLSDEQIKEIGATAPKVSLVLKLFIRYFSSIVSVAKQAPFIWRKHYTKGKLSVVEVNEKEKRIVIRLENLDLHPLVCRYLEGYFSTVVQMLLGVSATAKETKCSFSGDKYHQYLLNW